MNEQTIYIKTPISRDDLETVIAGLETACGGIRIEIAESFDLVVEDERQAAALKALFGADGSQPICNDQKEKKSGKPRLKFNKVLRPYKKREESYYIFLNSERVNQKITGGALGRMLQTGKLEVGTRLSHPTKGELVVVRESEDKPYTLVEIGNWEKQP
jgi:hypothetical protein